MPIQVEHLTHTYMTDSPFAATALEDVSLTIEDGELIGRAGPHRLRQVHAGAAFERPAEAHLRHGWWWTGWTLPKRA